MQNTDSPNAAGATEQHHTCACGALLTDGHTLCAPCEAKQQAEIDADDMRPRSCAMSCGRTTDIGEICAPCAAENVASGNGHFDYDGEEMLKYGKLGARS